MLLKTWRKTTGRAPTPSLSEGDSSNQGETTDATTVAQADHTENSESSIPAHSQNSAPYVAVGYKGNFYRAENRSVIGWIASESGSTISADKLQVRIGGSDSQVYPVKPVSAFDIEIKDSNENCLFFEVDASNIPEIDTADRVLYAELYILNRSETNNVSSEVKLLSSDIRRFNGEIFNLNPLMLPDSNVSLLGWCIDHDERSGLRIDRFSCGSQDMFYSDHTNVGQKQSESTVANSSQILCAPAEYSRITLTGLSSSQSPFLLTCPLTPEYNLQSEELEVAMRVRSDRPTWLTCRLKRNGVVISTAETLINYQWANFRRKLPESNITPLFRTVNYQLEVELKHEGRGFIDFAACAIGLSPKLSQIFLPTKTGTTTTDSLTEGHSSKLRNYIRNGDFSAWSNGVTFKTFKPRQQTADGWRFECRDAQVDQVDLQLVNVNERSSRENPWQRSYGLRVQTREFAGPMRVVTLLDHGFLNASSAKLSIGLSVTDGCSPVQFLRRIYILGRSIGKEEILYIIARKPRVHDHAMLEYLINEPTLIRLRRTLGVYSSLLLVIEYEVNSDVVLSSAELCQTEIIAATEQRVANGTLSHSGLYFEDASISAQSGTLNGLERWTGDVVKIDHNQTYHNKVPTGYQSSFRNVAVPSWTRPSRNYPTVDIVVPIFNALDALKDCLTSLIRETTVPYTLICVDDASALETREFLAELSENYPHVRVVTNSENIGYTKNVNRGIENSTADWICILNSDCIVTTNWLERLLDVGMSSPKAGIVSPLSNAASYQSIPRIRNDDNGWSFNPLPAAMQPNDMAKLVWEHSLSAHPRAGVANGFCQLIRRDMLDSIGWLDEASFPRGFGEENDLCARAVKSGWDIRIADDTYVYHVKSQSFGHIERKRLSKVGSSALKVKHPDIDWNVVTSELENEHSLVELRKRLIAAGI